MEFTRAANAPKIQYRSTPEARAAWEKVKGQPGSGLSLAGSYFVEQLKKKRYAPEYVREVEFLWQAVDQAQPARYPRMYAWRCLDTLMMAHGIRPIQDGYDYLVRVGGRSPSDLLDGAYVHLFGAGRDAVVTAHTAGAHVGDYCDRPEFISAMWMNTIFRVDFMPNRYEPCEPVYHHDVRTVVNGDGGGSVCWPCSLAALRAIRGAAEQEIWHPTMVKKVDAYVAREGIKL